MAAASDVPDRYDVVIDGHGYMLADQIEPSLPFRTHRAIYGMSDTFIERSNITGSYGDNTQEFYMVGSQNDWSLGEQQRYFRSADADKVRRYWQGQNVDVTSIPGQVTIRQGVSVQTFAAAVRACESLGPLVSDTGIGVVHTVSATNSYNLNAAGGIFDYGAHGLGATPARTGLCSDGSDIYLSTGAAGTVGVRKLATATSTFSTFSASAADSLEFLNNTLYGFRAATADLVRYDAAGTLTSLFAWKGGSGGIRNGTFSRLRAYGSKLLCLWANGPDGPEIWIYDGNGCQLLQVLPPNFHAYEMCVALGVVFISGSEMRIPSGDATKKITRPAIYYYANGTLGKLWQATTELGALTYTGSPTINPACSPFGSGVVFNDDTRGDLMYYDAALGGIHSIGTYTGTGDQPLLAASGEIVLHTRNQTNAYFYPDSTTVATTGKIFTSLFDFDNSLFKYVKSIRVDFDWAADGDGGTVDLYYRINTVDGAYTLITVNATSGYDYTIGMNAKSISLQINLNKGTSTYGPVLKRIYVRATPILNSFRNCQYNFNLSGAAGQAPVTLRDGTLSGETGAQMAANLFTTMKSQVPVTITDRFGTYTGIIEPSKSEFYEVHPGIGAPGTGSPNSGTYICRVTTREV